jgi:hypothetical protein
LTHIINARRPDLDLQMLTHDEIARVMTATGATPPPKPVANDPSF